MTITAIWHNGTITTGETWRELEDNIRRAQWTSFKSRQEFREEMRLRAKTWSGLKPQPMYPQTSQGFLRSLETSGMFLITVETESGEMK
jgi:hypothetical protein